jgi:hypothetical protein
MLFLALSSNVVQAKDQAEDQGKVQAKDQPKVQAKDQARIHSMYMPDGQLIDSPIHVYVQGIDNSVLQNAQLSLEYRKRDKKTAGSENTEGDQKVEGEIPVKVFRMIQNQQFEREIKGKKETTSGTELIFFFPVDQVKIPWYKAGTIFLPILYDEQGKPIARSRHVYIIHKLGTVIFVFMIIAPIVVVINFLARTDRRLFGIKELLRTADGRMSVSLTQAFLWTLAVGASVLMYGVSRLEVPDIPVSLWVLMGMSAATGVIGHYQADSVNKERVSRGATAKREAASLKQLVMVKLPDGTDDPDLSKAQLLFWTVITLSIFIIKSYTAGTLWDVPESLLVLMGISQMGYMSRQQTIIQLERKPSQGGQTPKAGEPVPASS